MRPGFPRTIFEFNTWFPDEESCSRFLIASRWPNGFVCPSCGGHDYYLVTTRNLLQCKACSHQVSPTAGTVMHRSKMPLTLWFQAAYLTTTHTPGLSALQFQRQVGLTSYQTAFTMLHKLRAAMVREGRDRLSGVVEVDETYIGGRKAGPRGRGALGKVIVAGAVDIRGTSANRIRLRVIPNVVQDTLITFVKENVEEGSVIRTDEFRAYNALEQIGYVREIATDLVHLHRVFSNLKIWLLGTHHGVSSQHLQAYLNEYTFRFNRRGTPMAAFQTVLGLIGTRLGPTYAGLYGVKKGRMGWVHPNPLPEPTR